MLDTESEPSEVESNSLARRVLLFLVGAIFVLPLFYIKLPLTLPNVDKAFAFYFLVGLALIFSVALYRLWRKLNFHLFDLLVIIFLAVLTASTFSGINPSQSFWGTIAHGDGLLMFLYLSAFYFLLRVFAGNKEWGFIWRLVAIVAGLVGIYTIFQVAGLESLLLPMKGSRALATFGNPVLLSGYLSLASIITLTLLLRGENKLIFGSAFLLQLVGLLLSGSRGSLMAFAIGALFLLWFFFKDKINIRRFWVTGGIVLVLAVFLVTLTPAKRIFTAPLVDSNRVLSWQIGLDAFSQKPLLGWGPESYEIAFEKFYKPIFEPYMTQAMWFDTAHNFVVQFLVTVGVLGLVAYLLFILCPAWFALKYRQHQNLLIAGVGTVLIINLIQNLFNFDSISTYVIVFAGVAFLATQLPALQISLKRVGLFLLPVLVIGSVIGFSILPSKVFAYYKTLSTTTILNRGDLASAQDRLLTANNTPYWNELLNFLIDPLYFNMADENFSQQKRGEAHDLVVFISQGMNNPTSRQNYSLARLHFPLINLGVTEAKQELDKFYQDAVNRIPNGAFLYTGWAADVSRLGHYEQARGLFKTALELNPEYTMAYIWSALNEIYAGSFDVAQEQLEQFWKFSDKYRVFHSGIPSDVYWAYRDMGREDLFDKFYQEYIGRYPDQK